MTKAPPKRSASFFWLDIANTLRCSRMSRGLVVPCGIEHSSNSLTHFEGLCVLVVFQCCALFCENPPPKGVK